MASVVDLRERVRGWLHREPRPVVPRSILVVDGSESSRTSTGQLIESLGYTAALVGSLHDATATLETADPSFILLGFELDDGEGLAAIAPLRELAPEIPIAMLAPNLWDARVAEAMRRGAVAYLARPFGPEDLRELLGRS